MLVFKFLNRVQYLVYNFLYDRVKKVVLRETLRLKSVREESLLSQVVLNSLLQRFREHETVGVCGCTGPRGDVAGTYFCEHIRRLLPFCCPCIIGSVTAP